MKKNIITIMILAISFITFGCITYCVITKKVNDIDLFIYERIQKCINPTNTKIMKLITMFGSILGMAICFGISLFLFKNNFDRIFLGLSMAGEVALNNVLKVIIQRPRPTINPLVNETGFSFPSGHSMACTAFFLFVIFFLWNSPLTKTLKIILTIPCILIILLVLFSRVYLGVHYSSDVIGGLFCSICYVTLLILLYPKMKSAFF